MPRPSVIGADDQITVRLPSSLVGRIDARADALGVTRSAVTRLVLEDHIEDPDLLERISADIRDGMIPSIPSELVVIRRPLDGE